MITFKQYRCIYSSDRRRFRPKFKAWWRPSADRVFGHHFLQNYHTRTRIKLPKVIILWISQTMIVFNQ